MTADTKLIVDAIGRLTEEVRRLRMALGAQSSAEAPRQPPAENAETSHAPRLDLEDLEEAVLGG